MKIQPDKENPFSKYAIIPKFLWRLGLNDSAQRVWATLWAKSEGAGFCQVSFRQLAHQTCLSGPAVLRATKELERKGALVVKRSGGTSSIYAPIWVVDGVMFLNGKPNPLEVSMDGILKELPEPEPPHYVNPGIDF